MTDDGIVFRRAETLADYEACVALQDDTWGPGFKELVPTAVLMVAQKMGGVCAGAFAPDGRLLGFVLGFTGVRHGEVAHWSDMLAVRPEARGARVGERLKHYQRLLCLEVGARVMYWTFDPLVARNAHLNLMRLGARASEYVVNMYGSNTGSPLHGALDTDRWIVAWSLTSSADDGVDDRGGSMLERHQRRPRYDGVFAVREAPGTHVPDGGALVDPLPDAAAVRVAVPHDHESLTLEARVQWRLVTRRAFLHYLGQGYEVTGFFRANDAQPPFYEMARP